MTLLNNKTLFQHTKSLLETLLTRLSTDETAILEAANLSMADLTARLQRALKTANYTKDEYCYIRDVFDTYFVYSGRYDGGMGHYAVPYTSDENGLITLGLPIEVISRTQYDTLDGTSYTPVSNTTVEETESSFTSDIVPLSETSVDLSEAQTRRIKLIAAGKGSSGFYPAAVLQRDGPNVFKKGLKMFWDHQTADQEKQQPEGSLDRLAAILETDATWENDGLYANARIYDHYAPKIKELAADIGVSIRASGKTRSQTINGINTPVIEAITSARSVDFVTTPGAGGKVLELFEAAKNTPITVTKPPVSSGIPIIIKDLTMADNDDITALRTLVEAQNLQIARLNEVMAQSAAQLVVNNYLRAVNLPAATKARLAKSLITSATLTEAGSLDTAALTILIETAVKDEAAYLAQLGSSGVNVGSNQTSVSLSNNSEDMSKLHESVNAAINAL